MMITCSAKGCPSSQTTKIDGRPISFYAFPEDDLRKNQWLHNCNLASGVKDKEPMHLCELHFERIHFTTSRDLKSSAVPTLFGRIEEPTKKYKTESILQTKVVSLKRKLDEQSYTTMMPPENPSTQHTDNAEDSVSGNKANVSINNATTTNGSATSTITGGNCEKNKEVYRLTIQIDKIRGKPGPRCKKLIPLLMLNNDMKDLTADEHETKKKSQSLQTPMRKACKQGSCKIRKCMYNSKPAFQCEICSKYYITRKEGSLDDKDNSIYHMVSFGSQSSNVCAKKHFICDICQTESSTQLMYDKHVRYHVSTDPSYPYKCHLCTKIFELKEDVKQHCLNEHPKLKTLNTLRQITSSTKAAQQNDYQCTSCNITFSNEQAYRNHLNSHKKKESLRSKINETNVFPVPNALTGSQIGILQPVKFSCNVCSKEFDNVGDVGVHTRTHLEDVKEGFKCNICKKLCKNNTAYTEHLKQHLSRAYPCPICSKAFINKTTLKIHQKTHGET